MRVRTFMAWLACWSVVFALGACRTEQAIPPQRYEVRGKVVAVNKDEGTVTVAHEAIPGYMAAMTMSYPLKDTWAFNVLKPGQSVHATLVVASDRAWLEGIVITEEAKPESASLAPAQARRGPQVGEAVPDFSLLNQDGRRIHLHQYHGQALLLTFIYTRCPLPDYCPLMSKNFAKILNELGGEKSLAASTHLLSISIDPAYDRPAVLRAYGLECAGKPAGEVFTHWEFASGTPEQVHQVAEFFGLSYWNESGQIVHALVTALIAPDGKVAKLYHGNEWQPVEVLGELRGLLGR